MQHLTVIAVGRPGKAYAALLADYERRLGRMCRFAAIELPEEPLDEKNASPAQVAAALAKEGARVLAALPKGAALAALCVEGKGLSTEELAARLDEAAQSGAGHLAFAIGSSHGLSDEVKAAAALRLSLSAMTLPHQLARLVLSEQLYRCLSIRAGTRYHK